MRSIQGTVTRTTMQIGRSVPPLEGTAFGTGRPARGHGGTADVVAYAREGGVPVKVV
jgi:hypothetical protein